MSKRKKQAKFKVLLNIKVNLDCFSKDWFLLHIALKHLLLI